jgi:hypothetical protein
MSELFVVGYRGPNCVLHDVANMPEEALDYIAQYMDEDERAELRRMKKAGYDVPAIFAAVVSMKGTIRAQFFMELWALRDM